MRYLSTFSGIGGFEIGIEKAFELPQSLNGQSLGAVGHERDKSDSDIGLRHGGRSRAVCVGYSEVDTHAIKTYEEHYEHHNYGDITAIDAAALPDFDLIVGGFPCQAFSVAGKRKGFDETRGTLFFDLARILKHKRPGHFVFENVKGLLSHDGGKTIQTIAGVLADLGYRIEWQVLNSKDFGVPQNRERIYIIGHLRERCGRQVLPIVGTEQPYSEPRQYAPQRAQAIATRHLDRNGGLISPIASTVQASETPHIIGTIIRTERPKGYAPKLPDEVGNTIRLGGTKSLTKKHAWDLVEDTQTRIRRLTPVECERLQGFPDNWTLGSNAQRYKQCGNAVTTNVVEAVMRKLKDCLV